MKNIESQQIPNIDVVIKNFINNHIRFNTIQLFKKSGQNIYTPEGTGVLVDFHGIFCLFTSRQIAEDTFENNQLYFKLGPHEYLLCTGKTEESEPKSKNIDIAYIIFDLDIAESLIDIGYKFLPKDKILQNHLPQDKPQYTAVGFTKPTSGQNQDDTQTNGSYIISPMALDNYYDKHIFTKEDNFIISYEQPQELMTGIKVKSKELFDMSGSGLWHISITKNNESIEYNYHLIGIITELYIHKSHKFLKATKINLLTHQLKAAIS